MLSSDLNYAGPLTVGFVDYINSYPLNGAFRLKGVEPGANLFYNTPSKLNLLFKQKVLDASFISITEFFEGDYTSDYVFGIASKEQVLSVNLYIQHDLASLDNAIVGVTQESHTSIQLLKVLCYHFWHVEPKFVTLDRTAAVSEYEGILLIGDEALKNYPFRGFKTIDLAAVWYEKTHLPFVFAIFAAQKDLSDMQMQELNFFTDTLNASLGWSEKHKKEIVALARKKTGLSKELIERYYQHFEYKFKSTHKEAINLFKHLSHEILCQST